MHVSEKLAQRHYAEHEGKPFYAGLVDYITSATSRRAVFGGTGRDRDHAEADGRDEP